MLEQLSVFGQGANDVVLGIGQFIVLNFQFGLIDAQLFQELGPVILLESGVGLGSGSGLLQRLPCTSSQVIEVQGSVGHGSSTITIHQETGLIAAPICRLRTEFTSQPGDPDLIHG